MYPSRFRYEAPRSLEEAITLLRDGGGEAKVLAGGQSLVPLMKLRFAAPELLVDINQLPGLDRLHVGADGEIRVGALVRHRDVERSPEIARAQLWQWIRHRVRTAEDTPVTLPLVRGLLREETAALRAGYPDPERLDRAAALLDALVAAETFPEFLTLAAYEAL